MRLSKGFERVGCFGEMGGIVGYILKTGFVYVF